MRYDYANNVLSVLGYFWQRVWKDKDFVSGLSAAVGTMQQQTDITYNEFEEYMSRLTLPVTHHLRWKQIVLSQEDMSLRSYGVLDGLQTGKSVLIGSSVPPIQYVFPWESALQTSFIVDSPSLIAETVLNVGADYVIKDSEIIFYVNPFDTLPNGAGVNADNDPIQTVECWGYCTDEDVLNIKNFFGTYVGLNTKSTDMFKRLTNSVWDLYTQGATIQNINQFLLVLTDCGSVTQDGTVSDIFTEANRLWVSTENGLYSAPEEFNAIVNVGDVIYEGQNIFDTFKIYEGRDIIPDTVIASFTAESGYLGGGYTAGLSFDNRNVPLSFAYYSTDSRTEVLTTEEGEWLIKDENGVDHVLTGPNSYIESGLSTQGVVAVPIFEIGGFDTDVEILRNKMANNIWSTQTDTIAALTQDQRPPYTINPFQFIQEAALKNNMLFIELNASAVVNTTAILSALRYLVNTIPAGTSFMMYIKETVPEEEYDLTSEVEETITGYIVGEILDVHTEANTVDTVYANKKVG